MLTRILRLLSWFALLPALAQSLQPAYGDPSADPKAARDSIVMASTTSTEQSGLFGYLLPRLTAATGIDVRVVAVGTGQALDLARRGDADLLLVHDPIAEEKLVQEGYGVARREIMHNDFVIVGPAKDPAGIAGMSRAADAFARVARARSAFLSRGDRSGTHAAELRLWDEAGVSPPASGSNWYQETGSGMGPTLNIASARGAYTLSDRATWLNFRNRGDLAILVQGDPVLFNRYSVILASEQKHPHVKAAAAAKVANWLASGEGQAIIGGYRLNGEQLFFPQALRRAGPAD